MEEGPVSHRMIPAEEFFTTYEPTGDADGWTWEEETVLLDTHDRVRMRELTADIRAHGMRNPIRVCDTEHRVIDGHHRAIVARLLGMTHVPVASAWESGWTPDLTGFPTEEDT